MARSANDGSPESSKLPASPPPETTLQVAIVDDLDVDANALATLLLDAASPRPIVIATITTESAFDALIREIKAGKCRYHVVVVDVFLWHSTGRQRNGVELLAAIEERSPERPVLICFASGQANPKEFITKDKQWLALDSGLHGRCTYLNKPASLSKEGAGETTTGREWRLHAELILSRYHNQPFLQHVFPVELGADADFLSTAEVKASLAKLIKLLSGARQKKNVEFALLVSQPSTGADKVGKLIRLSDAAGASSPDSMTISITHWNEEPGLLFHRLFVEWVPAFADTSAGGFLASNVGKAVVLLEMDGILDPVDDDATQKNEGVVDNLNRLVSASRYTARSGDVHHYGLIVLGVTPRTAERLLAKGNTGPGAAFLRSAKLDYGERQLRLPSLRDNVGFIETHAASWVSERSRRDRRLEPEALAVLTAYPWPGEFDEYRRVLTNLLSGEGSISREDVLHCLRIDEEALFAANAVRQWRDQPQLVFTNVVKLPFPRKTQTNAGLLLQWIAYCAEPTANESEFEKRYPQPYSSPKWKKCRAQIGEQARAFYKKKADAMPAAESAAPPAESLTGASGNMTEAQKAQVEKMLTRYWDEFRILAKSLESRRQS